jgi:hypothetical protein
MKLFAIVTVSFALTGTITMASADPPKDESGHGRWGRGGFERNDGFDRRSGRGRYREAVRVPRGHLPPPGECRTWYSGRPPGHQTPPHRC